jgi:hypothetical protein
LSKEETELGNMIDKVDQSFAEWKRGAIRVYTPIFLFVAAGGGTIALAIYLTRLVPLVVNGGLLDTGINILALAVATGALGFSLLSITLTYDWDDQKRRIEHRHHYGRLKVCGYDSLTLHALIKMKTLLPKDVTLKQAKTANPESFSEKEFVRRLLE